MKESNDITSLAPSAVKVYLNKSSKQEMIPSPLNINIAQRTKP